MALERLQKIMAAAGVASRRKSEDLIVAGRVSVNGQTVTELGAKADLEKDHIRVDGKLLQGAERKVYILLNKPKGYVSTVSDPEGRPTVMELLRGVSARLYPIGRLDYLSEGLLLLTNDGELAERLTRASSHVPKMYLVKISGKPSDDAIQRLRDGIVLPPENRYQQSKPERSVKTAPARISLARNAENPWYEVTLTEGRNRQIRRMFKQVGHDVEKIKRVQYGPLELDVPPGEYRRLTPQEVTRLTRSPNAGARPLPPTGEARVDRPTFAKKRRPDAKKRRPDQRPKREEGYRPYSRSADSGKRPAPSQGRSNRGPAGRPLPSGEARPDRPTFAKKQRPDQQRERKQGYRPYGKSADSGKRPAPSQGRSTGGRSDNRRPQRDRPKRPRH